METIGRYEVKGILGKGGMAVVMEAYDPLVNRYVAVKILSPGTVAGDGLKRRFEREARTLSLLDHPAIVPLYDFGEAEGRPYLVMRLMSGGSLRQRLQETPLSLEVISGILSRTAAGLDAIHAKGIVHRDIKPGNILFDEDDHAYLSDFGIVRLAEYSVQLTMEGVLGTPQYMAPEMAALEQITPQADIYALGITLFEMLTQSRPFNGISAIEIVRKHINEPVPDVRLVRLDASAAVQRVIEKGMAKRPEERYQTATAMAQDFAAALRTPIETTPSNTLVDVPFETEIDILAGFSIVQLKDAEVDVVPYQTTPDSLLNLRHVQEIARPTEANQQATRKKPSITQPAQLRLDPTMQSTAEYQVGTQEKTMVHCALQQQPEHGQTTTTQPNQERSKASNPRNALMVLAPVFIFVILGLGVAITALVVFLPDVQAALGLGELLPAATASPTAEAVGVSVSLDGTATATRFPTAIPMPGAVGSAVMIETATVLEDDNRAQLDFLERGELVTVLARSTPTRGSFLYVETIIGEPQTGWICFDAVRWEDEWASYEALPTREIISQ